jgi:hypothetical protein
MLDKAPDSGRNGEDTVIVTRFRDVDSLTCRITTLNHYLFKFFFPDLPSMLPSSGALKFFRQGF